MRALLLAALVITGCAQPLTKAQPRPAPTGKTAGSVAGNARQRSTVCSYTIPGQPEFGMTCKER
jgi:hypothetical protein